MKDKIKSKNIGAIAVVFLVLGILLITFSGNKKTEQASEEKLTFDECAYEERLELRLREIIEKIDGVGNVSVMITLEGSALYNYATDTVRDTKSDGDSKRESTVVLSVNGSNSKDAVVSGYSLPNVKGVAVVCSRNLTPTLQAKVIGIASSALGVSTSKVYVTN